MRFFVLIAMMTAAAAIGCGESGSESDGGPDGGPDGGDTDTGVDSDTSTGFDPDDPGIHVFVEMGSVLMMGQPVDLCIGGFMPAAREDFDPPDEEQQIPLDSCAVVEELPDPEPECETDEDCYPEQECVPEYDDNDQPIPGSEHCATPRELMDVGPFTMDGFAGGQLELFYNESQSGAYTTTDPGDGTLPPGELVYDTTYTFQGEGDPAQGLGEFQGELYVAPAIEMTSPEMVELPMGDLPGIEVDPGQDLVLEWTGANEDGELVFNLAGGPQGGGTPIECRVADDGEFVIPAEMVQTAGLGDVAFFNMLTIDRRGTGSAQGEGVTFDDVEVIQTLLVNVSKIDE